MAFNEVFQQLLSPPILFFAIGVLAAVLRSDLTIPNSVGSILSVFILASIGLRAGVAVSETGLAEALLPALLSVLIGALLTAMVYGILAWATKVGRANAASVAAHYGAVSSVTLAVAIMYLDDLGVTYEAYVPALYPFMDTAALVTAVVLSRLGSATTTTTGISMPTLVRETLTSKAPLLLLGCFVVGLVNGEAGTAAVMPLFAMMFPGVLAIFMLDVGIVAGGRLPHLLTVEKRVFVIGLLLPPVHGLIAVSLGTLIGLSPGGATILAALAAGASYISAPAVMRTATPEANPALSLAMALGLAFPFNVSVGIPLYQQAAQWLAGIL